MPQLQSHGHEIKVWALMALLGVVIMIAAWIFWAKISGFLIYRQLRSTPCVKARAARKNIRSPPKVTVDDAPDRPPVHF
jgi:hypothetical protein